MLTRIDPPTIPPGPYPVRICTNRTMEDVLTIDVHDPVLYPVPQGEIVVSLQSQTSVTWEKQIRSYNFCNILASPILVTKNANHGGFYNRYRITKPNCANGTNTLVFAKAKLAGAMTNMYNIDHRQFWQLFSGRRIHIVWWSD